MRSHTKRHTIRKRRAFILSALILLLLLLAGTVSAMEGPDDPAPPEADASYDDMVDITPWHKVYLEPGHVYDVSTAKKNTTVYIDDPGSYWLKGKSTYCRVVVRSGGVYIYLHDGLDIDPGIYSYVGSSTAAITIEDQGGEVHLISKKDASIYFGGYYYAPAIRKDRHNTKLIFETEDPDHPGTITAYRSRASHSAAIGSVYRIVADNECNGNMEFRSGIIKATGGVNAAGIGAGSGANHCMNLLFSGADVTATGIGYGAGIGGGLSCGASNIKITGGKIVAHGDEGAGIGGGKTTNSYGGRCGTITITGGDITATSESASGIGCGVEGSIDRINISGGNITAVCESLMGAGIGGTGSNFYGRCGEINISGGTIVAKGGPDGGVGIGSAFSGESGSTTVNISGGYITATAGKKNYSIGGGGPGALQDKGHCYVKISGGTVICQPTVGGSIGSRYDLTCTITGGSVFGSVKGTPKDANGNPVVLVNLDLHGCPEFTPVKSAIISSPSENYGLNDVITWGGLPNSYSVVYAWLPKGTVTTEMTAAGVKYYGNACTTDGQGDLYRSTDIILHANAPSGEQGVSDGRAYAIAEETSTRELSHAVRPGYTLAGYAQMRSSAKILLNPDGSFAPDIPDFTNSKGEWTRQGGTAELYALWKEIRFTVRFDANVPSGTASTVSGSMPDQAFVYGQTDPLSADAFSLTGYTFAGWNTKADGSGTALRDSDDGCRLCTENGGTVTLYAQWTPVTYSVIFNSNGAQGSMKPQTMTYDKPEALLPNSFTMEGQVFLGWQGLGFGSFYTDGQTVKNLASGQNATVELYAEWGSASNIAIGISLDGRQQSGCTIRLSADGTAFDVKFSEDHPGVYTSDADIPPDEYAVTINGTDTGRTITVPGSGTVDLFPYYTFKAAAGDHIRSVTVDSTGVSVPFGSVSGWPAGSRFSVKAGKTDTGYLFDEWQSAGTAPEFIDGTPKSSSVTVAIRGTTSLLAAARPAGYAVRFDANAPAGASTQVTGSMPDQTFAYAEAKALTACGYALEGYTFTGWNTAPGGTGTSYADGVSVSGLTDIDGAVVPLYAQWTPVTYRVTFNNNFGTGAMPAQLLTFDEPAKLFANQFGYEGRFFTGWNLNAAGTAQAFTDEQEVLNLASEQDARITLYAQWDVLSVTDPSSVTVTEGGTATFSVTATGPETLTYQWQIKRADAVLTGSAVTLSEGDDPDVGWEDIPGATGSSCTTGKVTPANDGDQYRCKVSDGLDTVTSRAATLSVTVIVPLTVTDPEDATVTEGDTATFSVTAEGTGDLAYQWQIDRGSGWKDIEGATHDTYTTAETTVDNDGYRYRCKVEDERGSVTSGAATLTVIRELTVTDPQDAAVLVGQKATFSVTATGQGKLRYQWQVDRGSGWKDIIGATKASYTTAAAKLSNDGYLYRCTVTDDVTAVTSGAARLTVTKIPHTGDDSRPLLWLGLALFAGAALITDKKKRTARS